jgi:hypothetical protein
MKVTLLLPLTGIERFLLWTVKWERHLIILDSDALNDCHLTKVISSRKIQAPCAAFTAHAL